MATVYLARQRSLGRLVALKALKPSLAAEPGYRRRFHREAQAAAALSHANIVQIFEVGQADSVHFLAQEFVPGRNVRQLIESLGPLDIGLTVAVLSQAAAAIGRAGEAGIVHRDIKPDNILVTAAGEAKVADFGLARVLKHADAQQLTEVGVAMGTPLYMSPEQIEGRDVATQSDIYSLGATAFHMLAGRPPFQADSALALAMHHLKTPPPPLSEFRPDCPAPLADIVMRMLAKDADKRPGAGGELAAWLRALPIPAPENEDWKTWLPADPVEESETAIFAATMRLQTAMTPAESVSGNRPRTSIVGRWAGWAVVAISVGAAAFGAGAMLAWRFASPPLLSSAGNIEDALVERRETAEAQWLYASLLGDDEIAWRSVWKHFPPEESPTNQYYANLAKQGLARMLVAEGRYDEARPLLKELSELPAEEQEFVLFGKAGLAIVLSHAGEHEASTRYAADVLPHIDKLDEAARKELRAAIARNQAALGKT